MPDQNTNRHLRPRLTPQTRPQIRRRYRNLITKEHPDKGGDADRFSAIQRAYDVLSNAAKRAQYDETGVAERTADEELLEAFSGGALLRLCLVGIESALAERGASWTPRK